MDKIGYSLGFKEALNKSTFAEWRAVFRQMKAKNRWNTLRISRF